MAYDAFLKIETIDGESTAKGHEGAIELLSYSWGATQSGVAGGGTGGGGGTGKVTLQDFHFVANFSKASPRLFEGVATGRHYPTADLSVRKAGANTDFVKLRMSDVIISSYQVGGSGEIPTDQVSINFVKIEF